MARLRRTVKPTETESVTIEQLTEEVRNYIKKELNMSVKEFANSEKIQELGIDIKPSSIEIALSKSKVTNFKIVQVLYESFGLGKLNRKIIVRKETVIVRER